MANTLRFTRRDMTSPGFYSDEKYTKKSPDKKVFNESNSLAVSVDWAAVFDYTFDDTFPAE